MKKEITQVDIQAACERSTTRWQMNDSIVTGLTLRAGRQSAGWLWRSTTGAVVRKKFGDPKSMPLDVARAIAEEARRHHVGGGDINDEWVREAQVRHGIALETPPEWTEPPGPWTWSQAAEVYMRHQVAEGRARLTVDGTRKALLRILGEFNDRLLTDIDLEDVADSIDRLHRQYPGSVPLAVKAARPFSKWISSGDRVTKSGRDDHFLADLAVPDARPRVRKPDIRSIAGPRVEEVAYVVAVCRSGLLEDSAARALEVCILTGLRRTAVVSARLEDVRGGVWHVPAAALKRKVSIRISLTNRLRDLMQSDDEEWIFPQPRKMFSGARKHLDQAAIGRSTWEVPGALTTIECVTAMRRYFSSTENGDPDLHGHLNLLSDAGAPAEEGGDNKLYNGVSARDWRHDIIVQWGNAVEAAVKEVRLDTEALAAAIKLKRPHHDG